MAGVTATGADVKPQARGIGLWMLGILLVTVGLDQGTKQLAVRTLKGEPATTYLGGLLRIEYAENPGAFLGLGGRLPPAVGFWVFVLGMAAILTGLAVWLLRARNQPRGVVLAMSLVFAGGLSNWFDRVANDGRVVDFLNLGIGRLRTGIFNVADVAIMAGVFLALIASTLHERRRRRGATAS